VSYRINDQIKAPELRVIGDDGKQLGILPRDKALESAKKLGLSLIEIAPQAKPPVAKLTDLGKFRYQEEKKLRSQQKKAKGGELKEIRFSPFIAENDFNIRLARIKEWLGEKFKVKIVIIFTGRQMGSTRFGYQIIKRILDVFGEGVITDMEPKFFGRRLMTIISPLSHKKVENNNIEQKELNNAKSKNQKIVNKKI